MIQAVLISLLAFGGSWAALMVVEAAYYRLRQNNDKSYRWGVWTLSILLGLYAFITSLGR